MMKLALIPFLASMAITTTTTTTNAFAPVPATRAAVLRKSTNLYAEGGPPQYQKREAILKEAEMVGKGSCMLHLETSSDVDDNDGDAATAALDYEPGHVLALEIQSSSSDLSEYNTKVAKENDGWLRGPYTVSRCTDTSLDVLIKVVGDKSKQMSEAKPGTVLKFGGKFKVPIFEGIVNADSAASTKRVVFISSGVGVGPCIGAIEQMLQDESFTAKVDLYPSYRTSEEIVSPDYLDRLAAENDQFNWKPIVSSEMGRISSSEESVAMIASNVDNDCDICSLQETHYHLIGNGQMVNEWQQGLTKAGVPGDKITTESYFNHKEKVRDEAIETIASAVAKQQSPASVA